MQNLASPAVIRQLMQRHGMRFSKQLGQNFIINPAICPKIAELGGAGPQVGALEIGPGIGVLTAELAQRCNKVVAIELDNRLLPILAETLGEFKNVTVLHGDALQVDLHALLREQFAGMEVIVCANLPYYITSPVLMRLLEERLPLRTITVMVQKEAARRICAPLPSRQAGAITVAVAWYTTARVLFDVAPGSFLPAPEVHSSVIRLDLRDAPPAPVADQALFFRVVKAAFSQRRKTLLNCLSAGLSADKRQIQAVLERAGVPPSARAEQLTLEQFAAVANAVHTSE